MGRWARGIRKPTLAELAHLGEVIGGIGVIVTMIYLAVQVRANSELLRAQQHYLTNQLDQGLQRLVIADEGLARLLVKAAGDPKQLSAAERVRFYTYETQFSADAEYAYYEYADGALDKDIWEAWVEGIAEHFRSSAGAREFWKNNKASFGKRYQDFVDRLLSKIQATEKARDSREESGLPVRPRLSRWRDRRRT